MLNRLIKTINGLLGGSSDIADSPNDLTDDVLFSKKEVPLDETFVKSFTDYNGRFIYCENEQEVINSLKEIKEFLGFDCVFCFDEDLRGILNDLSIKYCSSCSESKTAFIKCEYLTAFDGGIVVSSIQTGKTRLSKSIEQYIVYAHTSQITKNISSAMELLSIEHKGRLPINISCIKKDIHSINGDGSPKEICLLLVEEKENV